MLDFNYSRVSGWDAAQRHKGSWRGVGDGCESGARLHRYMWEGGRRRKGSEGESGEDSSGVITEEMEDVEGDRLERLQDAARKPYVQCITRDDRETTEQSTEV